MSYWDRISATSMAPQVKERVLELYDMDLGNAQSPHKLGSSALKIIEAARQQVANLIHARAGEIVFTATGTESNNLAIQGIAHAASRHRSARKIIISAVEHISVSRTVKELELSGYHTEIIPVDLYGRIDLKAYSSALDESVLMVSVQLANPEIGTIQPVKNLAAMAKDKGIPIHTDAVAAGGWMPIDVTNLGVDALSLAGTMFHGPPGAAALYIRRGTPVAPIFFGGFQEHNKRPGMENIYAIAGFGVAAELSMEEMDQRMKHGYELSSALKAGLADIDEVIFTGDWEHRIPGHLSMIVKYVEGEALLLMLDMNGICAASGPSCTAKDLKISPVLMQLGLDHTEAQGSLVFSCVRDSSLEDVRKITEVLPPIVERLRSMSPLWIDLSEE